MYIFRRRIHIKYILEYDAQHKYQDRIRLIRCNEQGIDFESDVLDYMGGLNAEEAQFSDSLYRIIDGSWAIGIIKFQLYIFRLFSNRIYIDISNIVMKIQKISLTNISILISIFEKYGKSLNDEYSLEIWTNYSFL